MKITVDIDCTAQEAREFLGLPDVAPAQRAFVEALGKRMTDSVAAMDGDALFKSWMPEGMAGLEHRREMWRMGSGGETKK